MNKTEFDNLTTQDFRKLTKKELRDIVGKQAANANKRLDTIRSTRGASQTAVNMVESSGGRFTTKGKVTHADLIKEAKRIQSFNRSKAGTVKGAKQQGNEILEAAGFKQTDVEKKKPSDKKKTTKRQKSLKDIREDIEKKKKQIEQEQGKEAAQKYKKRADAQFKSIQKKRKQREAKRKGQEEETQKKETAKETQTQAEDEPTFDEVLEEADRIIEEFDKEHQEEADLETGAMSSKDGESQEQWMLDQKKQAEQSQEFMKKADMTESWSQAFV